MAVTAVTPMITRIDFHMQWCLFMIQHLTVLLSYVFNVNVQKNLKPSSRKFNSQNSTTEDHMMSMEVYVDYIIALEKKELDITNRAPDCDHFQRQCQAETRASCHFVEGSTPEKKRFQVRQ